MSKNKKHVDTDALNALESFKQNFNFDQCFGMSKNEINDFGKFLDMISIDNIDDKKTEFPDFKTMNGFIEHFQVTAGKDDKKGAVNRVIDSEMNKIVGDRGHAVAVKNSELNNFYNSFEKHFRDHIFKYERDENKNRYDIKCFFIELRDVVLYYGNNGFKTNSGNIYFNGLLAEKTGSYLPHLDIVLLNKICELNKDGCIDFIMFYNFITKRQSVIKTSRIIDIKELLNKFDVRIASAGLNLEHRHGVLL